MISSSISAQNLNNPYQFYEPLGGLFDKDSIRSIYIDFIDPNYHSILVNSFFTNPKYRIRRQLHVMVLFMIVLGLDTKATQLFVCLMMWVILRFLII